MIFINREFNKKKCDKNTNTLRYFTNDASCSTELHPTIKVFAKQFNNPKVLYINSNKNSALKFNLNQKTNCGSYATPSIQSKIQVQAATASDQEAV